MPDLGPLHPEVVHFVVGLGLVGILLRLISLTGRMAWTNQAAAALMILCAGASVVAVKSGTDTHDNAERIPGARQAVMDHEDWGYYTRNVLLGVAGLEILGLIFGSSGAGRALRFLSAGGGLGCVGHELHPHVHVARRQALFGLLPIDEDTHHRVRMRELAVLDP